MMAMLMGLPWKWIGGILAVLALVGGIYMKGSIDGSAHIQHKWDVQIAKDKGKMDVLNEKLRHTNDSITTEYVDRWNTIKEKEYVYVDSAKGTVPSQFEVSNAWVYLHDKAARNEVAGDADKLKDPTSSGIKDNQALALIVSNYSTCNQYINQIVELQKWINESKRQVEESNKK